MDDLYRGYILDHYNNPRNFGTIEYPDISHEEDNPLCGDKIRIDLKLKDGKIDQILFSGEGCAISKASASILTEMVKGQDLSWVKGLSKDEILEELGIQLSAVRIKCALLALKVLKAGIYGISSWPGEEE